MGCESCENSGNAPGCKSHGACASGGCNKMEVYNWLTDVALPYGQKAFDCVEVRFKNSRKGFYRNFYNLLLQEGDIVVVEGAPGFDVGVVSVCGELARLQMSKKMVDDNSHEIKKVFRKAKDTDIEKWHESRKLEQDTMFNARVIASGLGLEMKISDVEYQGDGSKATFYYTADDRVDFRELIKILAEKFNVRIEMRQIGARQEAQRLGGLGSCGRELCCSTWINDFRSVSTSAARYQQLSLNPQKLAGQCGKLKCCLNYELDMYLEAYKKLPSNHIKLHTKKGSASCIKVDLFKRRMWYIYDDEDIKIPIGLDVEWVEEIIALNKKNEKPDELKDFVKEVEVAVEPDYDNVDGQDSLTRFDKKNKKPRKKPAKRKTNNNNNSNKRRKFNKDAKVKK